MERFSRFPFRHAVFDILPLLWPQLRRRTGQVRIPDEAKAGGYDLVCLGSPTWFFTTCMPLRSYLRSDEARAVLAGTPFGAYVVCRRYWSINLKEVRRLGIAQRREIRRRHPLHLRRRAGPVAAGALELLRQGRDARARIRDQDPSDQPQARLRQQATAFANTLADGLAPAAQVREAAATAGDGD